MVKLSLLFVKRRERNRIGRGRGNFLQSDNVEYWVELHYPKITRPKLITSKSAYLNLLLLSLNTSKVAEIQIGCFQRRAQFSFNKHQISGRMDDSCYSSGSEESQSHASLSRESSDALSSDLSMSRLKIGKSISWWTRSGEVKRDTEQWTMASIE